MAKSLDQTAEQLGNILLSSGLHLTTAESCTAGLISMTLAAVESSGDFYTSGFVTYSENAKIRLLGVHPDTLKQHTAVSEHYLVWLGIAGRQGRGGVSSVQRRSEIRDGAGHAVRAGRVDQTAAASQSIKARGTRLINAG